VTLKLCSVEGCTREAKTRMSLCSMHYSRLRNWGHLGPPGPIKAPRLKGSTPAERLRLNSVISPEGCWRWQGAVTARGYGMVRVGPVNWPVHRLSYATFVGPIPEGLQIDHVYARGCRHKDCCNPDHLEAVTSRENTLRSLTGPSAVNARKTHCQNGHPFEEWGRPQSNGGRYCLLCRREYHREWRRRLRGA
jgi:hypothetical protein